MNTHRPGSPDLPGGLWPRDWSRDGREPFSPAAGLGGPAGDDPYGWYVTGGYGDGEFTPGPQAEDARGSYNRGRLGHHFDGAAPRSINQGTPPSPSRPARLPRNFRRADARLLDDVHEAIVGTGCPAGDVHAACHEGVVTLTGTVSRRDDRFRFEHAAADVLGVRDVDNQLKVRAGDEDRHPRGGLTGIAGAALEGVRAAARDNQPAADD